MTEQGTSFTKLFSKEFPTGSGTEADPHYAALGSPTIIAIEKMVEAAKMFSDHWFALSSAAKVQIDTHHQTAIILTTKEHSSTTILHRALTDWGYEVQMN